MSIFIKESVRVIEYGITVRALKREYFIFGRCFFVLLRVRVGAISDGYYRVSFPFYRRIV